MKTFVIDSMHCLIRLRAGKKRAPVGTERASKGRQTVATDVIALHLRSMAQRPSSSSAICCASIAGTRRGDTRDRMREAEDRPKRYRSTARGSVEH